MSWLDLPEPEWIDDDGNGRFFCDECMAWHNVSVLSVKTGQDIEARKAQRKATDDTYINLEAALFEAQWQEFMLSTKGVEAELQAERTRP